MAFVLLLTSLINAHIVFNIAVFSVAVWLIDFYVFSLRITKWIRCTIIVDVRFPIWKTEVLVSALDAPEYLKP